ncbi:MAG: CDP-alcohol phosphatidyltransferase family protein [Planctomycetota bacterium]|jgi:CDP-diacylglycerol--glycerol-3-phosphate 3-phosphatidyltransferase
MIGRGIGSAAAAARDVVARGLVGLGVHPNTLTIIGTVLTVAAGAGFAIGAGARFGWSVSLHGDVGAWGLLTGVVLALAMLCDCLDGAVARIGRQKTPFGAFLDSTLDRFSDFAIYAGIAVYYAWPGHTNVTYILLCMVAFFNAVMISYTRARAENLVESCSVGYWQRPERSGAILVGTFAFNIPALLIQQAALPLLTACRRIGHTQALLAMKTPITDPRQGNWWLKIRLWRWPRGTWAYDVVAVANGAWLMFVNIPAADPLGDCLRSVGP